MWAEVSVSEINQGAERGRCGAIISSWESNSFDERHGLQLVYLLLSFTVTDASGAGRIAALGQGLTCRLVITEALRHPRFRHLKPELWVRDILSEIENNPRYTLPGAGITANISVHLGGSPLFEQAADRGAWRLAQS